MHTYSKNKVDISQKKKVLNFWTLVDSTILKKNCCSSELDCVFKYFEISLVCLVVLDLFFNCEHFMAVFLRSFFLSKRGF